MYKQEIYTIALDPTVGSEISKTRPCLVISPNEMNNFLKTVIIAPITSQYRDIPSRIEIKATPQSGLDVDSYVALDQIKTIDKSRGIRRMGKISNSEAKEVSDFLQEMFA